MLADTAVVGRYIDHEIRIIMSWIIHSFIHLCHLFNVFNMKKQNKTNKQKKPLLTGWSHAHHKWHLHHKPYWGSSWVVLIAPCFNHTNCSYMPVNWWVAHIFTASNNGPTHVLDSAYLVASSARLLLLAIRELLFWCAAHLIITHALGQ